MWTVIILITVVRVLDQLTARLLQNLVTAVLVVSSLQSQSERTEYIDGFNKCGDWHKTGANMATFKNRSPSRGFCRLKKWRHHCFQSVKLYIDPDSDGANDAFFIDQLKLTNNNMQSLKWGRNKGRGWCLSNKKTDKFAGPNGDISCHSCILFERDGE
jgi:hypothetical protein